ncbi:MAG: DUF4287 domain-containing protein [Alphaproteobacteria bacterium]|nr:DUF4287 domain-containing protein [Alphaproteobacteria bacterium]MCB9698088.1 DUF4287 domain-containing protein [Alphaproteobacteria bacterium]
MGLTVQEMLQKMRDGVAARTGHDFDHWVGVARASGIIGHKALTDHLKTTHALNHNEAQWAAWAVLDPGRLTAYDAPADLVDELYAGKKAGLRPVYDALMAAGTALPGVKSTVCKTYTSLSGATQFAILAPRTNKSVDLELILPEDASHPALETFKSSNPKFTRRVRISDAAQVDEAVVGLLRLARAQVG